MSEPIVAHISSAEMHLIPASSAHAVGVESPASPPLHAIDPSSHTTNADSAVVVPPQPSSPAPSLDDPSVLVDHDAPSNTPPCGQHEPSIGVQESDHEGDGSEGGEGSEGGVSPSTHAQTSSVPVRTGSIASISTANTELPILFANGIDPPPDSTSFHHSIATSGMNRTIHSTTSLPLMMTELQSFIRVDQTMQAQSYIAQSLLAVHIALTRIALHLHRARPMRPSAKSEHIRLAIESIGRMSTEEEVYTDEETALAREQYDLLRILDSLDGANYAKAVIAKSLKQEHTVRDRHTGKVSTQIYWRQTFALHLYKARDHALMEDVRNRKGVGGGRE